MKKYISLILAAIIMLCALGCGGEPSVKQTVKDGMKTYYEMSDGTWKCDDHIYKYRLEIKGRLNNAAADSVYVYLSNIEEISFEKAWKAGGLSSNTEDYFPVEDAVLVDMRNE